MIGGSTARRRGFLTLFTIRGTGTGTKASRRDNRGCDSYAPVRRCEFLIFPPSLATIRSSLTLTSRLAEVVDVISKQTTVRIWVSSGSQPSPLTSLPDFLAPWQFHAIRTLEVMYQGFPDETGNALFLRRWAGMVDTIRRMEGLQELWIWVSITQCVCIDPRQKKLATMPIWGTDWLKEVLAGDHDHEIGTNGLIGVFSAWEAPRSAKDKVGRFNLEAWKLLKCLTL